MELTERRKTLLPDWRRLVFWLGLVVAFALCTGPLLDPDLPWHLSAARNMAATGGVPRGDFLSWTMAGKPWVDFEWGTQLIFYALYKAGGTTALCLFKAVAYFCITLFFAALLELWALPVLWTGLAAPLFALALLPIAQIRPEIFSLLLFSLELYLLERRRLGRLVMSDRSLLALHLPLYILWANLHAGFVTGLLLCACYCAGEFIAAGRRKAAYLFALAAVGAAGTLLNPYGVKIYGVLIDHWRHLDYLHYLISEWDMPGFSKYHLDGYWFVVAVSFAGLLSAVVSGVELPPAHLAAILVFGVLSSRAVRTVPYAVLLIYPLALFAWSQISPPKWWRLAKVPLLAVFAAFVVCSAVPIARGFNILSLPGPLLAKGPQRACGFLLSEKKVLSGLRMYNPYNWGGYLGFALYPDYKVFIDGRYLFVDLLAQDDDAVHDPAQWRAFMDEKGVDFVLNFNSGVMLRKSDDAIGHPFSAVALPAKEWALVYWDQVAIVLVRRTKVPADWLARHEFKLLYPHDLRSLQDKIISGRVKGADVRSELARYAVEIGDPQETAKLKYWYSSLAGRKI